MSIGKYKSLPGGLDVAVLQMDATNPTHESVLGKALHDAVAFEAKVHDTGFDTARFKKIMKALKANKIQAWFMLAGWENCQPRVVSAAIDFPTVLTKWEDGEFKHYPAKYREDTCFVPNVLRELVNERPAGKEFPQHIGMGEYFEQETMRVMATDDPSELIYGGRVAEYSAHSIKMIKLLGQIGAKLGTEKTGTIVELNGLSPDIHDRWKVDVKIEALTDNNTSSPLDHVFAVNWASPDDKQKIVASFTRGISTFTGDVVTRVQFTSNGSLPQEAVMKDVLASMLEAGQKEIGKRQWGEKVQAANDGTFEPAYIAPVMRIHAFEEPAIVSALKDLKAATRSLGPHPMLPLIVDFKTTPEEKLAFKPKEAASHDAVRPMDISNRPYFNFELAA